MGYLNRVKSFFGYTDSYYTLSAYELRYKRWKRLAFALLVIIFLGFLLFPGTDDSSVTRSHYAQINVDLNPSGDISWLSQLEKASRNDSVKGILLFIDQAIVDTNAHAFTEHALQVIDTAKHYKPVVSYIYGYAHGDNYLLATSANYIVTQETASVGGLSSLDTRFDLNPLMKNLGVEVINKGFGDYKVLPEKNSPNYDKFISHRKSLYQKMHQWMIRVVGENRHLKPEALAYVIDGQWYMGSRSVELGLCDQVGDETDALNWLYKHSSYRRLPVIKYDKSGKGDINFTSSLLSYVFNFKSEKSFSKLEKFVSNLVAKQKKAWMIEYINGLLVV